MCSIKSHNFKKISTCGNLKPNLGTVNTNNDAAFVVYAFGQSIAVHVCNGTGILDEQKIGQLSDT